MADAQDGGFLGGLEGILSNPLLQGAASAYLNYIGTPRYMRRGGALMNAGLGGLGAFNQAMAEKERAPLMQAQVAKAQEDVAESKGKQQALAGMSPQERNAFYLGGGPAYEQLQVAHTANKDTAAQFALAHPDPLGQQIAASAANAPKYMSFTDLEKAYGDAVQNPHKLDKILADITKSQAEASRATAEASLVPTHKAELEAATEQHRASAAKDTAEAAGGNGVKPKLATIYGPGGATKEVEVRPGYDPAKAEGAGWSLKSPGASKDSTTQANALLSSFARENPVHLWTNTASWVQDATNYLVGRGIDPTVAQSMASSFARQSSGGTAAAATPPAEGGGTPHPGIVGRY